MAFEAIDIESFIRLTKEHLVIDVRSPSEFHHAHIPGAYSLPLFDDEERKQVGTTYKQVSREDAIKLGLDFFGPKMKIMVSQVEELLHERNSKMILVHCWRGGMRSGAVAWLLDLYGFKVYTLKGGYKTFRNWVLAQFSKEYSLRILSGYTGSGKTDILREFRNFNEAVVDLEKLAIHRGSTFGSLGLPPQPSNEYFENKLALELFWLTQEKPNQEIWLESESSRIGQDMIHPHFFRQMKEARRIHIDIPLEKRLDYIVEEYGVFSIEELIAGVDRIQKRLGGLDAKNAKEHLLNGNIRAAFEILIRYYDRTYNGTQIFQPAYMDIHLEDTDAIKNATLILEKTRT